MAVTLRRLDLLLQMNGCLVERKQVDDSLQSAMQEESDEESSDGEDMEGIDEKGQAQKKGGIQWRRCSGREAVDEARLGLVLAALDQLSQAGAR